MHMPAGMYAWPHAGFALQMQHVWHACTAHPKGQALKCSDKPADVYEAYLFRGLEKPLLVLVESPFKFVFCTQCLLLQLFPTMLQLLDEDPYLQHKAERANNRGDYKKSQVKWDQVLDQVLDFVACE